MNYQAKILSPDQLPAWREELRRAGKTLVATNGCFDILHLGHVACLQTARNLGDALLVGVTADAHVRELKGAGRPLNSEADRAGVLAALESVDRVFVFQEKTAVQFLSVARPDIYVKGGDYTLETMNAEERKFVEGYGGKVALIPMLPGRSTTSLLERAKS